MTRNELNTHYDTESHNVLEHTTPGYKKVSLIVWDKHYVDPSRHCLPTDTREEKRENVEAETKVCCVSNRCINNAGFY